MATNDVVRQPATIPTAPKAAKAEAQATTQTAPKKRDMHMELVASMQAPEALKKLVLGDESLKKQALSTSAQTMGFTLGQVLGMYTKEELRANDGKDGGKVSAGGHAINYQRSNLYPAQEDGTNPQLLRKGSPNPNLLTNKIGDKVSNNDFVSMTRINGWPQALLDTPVSIEFNTKKGGELGEKDTSADAKVSVVWRVRANTHIITKDETSKMQAAANEAKANGKEFAVKTGMTVFDNSLQPSNFPSFQGMGAAQYQNSAYLRDEANLNAAVLAGNKAAINYQQMKVTKGLKEEGGVDAPSIPDLPDDGVEV